MDRKKALKNIVALLGLPFIPLGLLSKPNQIKQATRPIHKFGHNPSVDDKIDDIIIQTADRDADILREMYPERHKWNK